MWLRVCVQIKFEVTGPCGVCNMSATEVSAKPFFTRTSPVHLLKHFFFQISPILMDSMPVAQSWLAASQSDLLSCTMSIKWLIVSHKKQSCEVLCGKMPGRIISQSAFLKFKLWCRTCCADHWQVLLNYIEVICICPTTNLNLLLHSFGRFTTYSWLSWQLFLQSPWQPAMTHLHSFFVPYVLNTHSGPVHGSSFRVHGQQDEVSLMKFKEIFSLSMVEGNLSLTNNWRTELKAEGKTI